MLPPRHPGESRVHANATAWIPASAGMTDNADTTLGRTL